MATINTIEDLFRILDENPQWLEALRARLLTRELLELPEKFAQFVAATEQRFDKVANVKPPASRADSSEKFVVATGFRGRDPV